MRNLTKKVVTWLDTPPDDSSFFGARVRRAWQAIRAISRRRATAYASTLKKVATDPDLLPCPFCGGEATLWGTQDTEWIACGKCFATTDVFDLGAGKAVESWSRRVGQEEFDPCYEVLCARCGRVLADDLKEFCDHCQGSKDREGVLWIPCGRFPLKEIAQGRRACRAGWRDRGEGMDRLSVVKSSNGKLLLERETGDYGEDHEDFSGIEDMLATDWELEEPREQGKI